MSASCPQSEQLAEVKKELDAQRAVNAMEREALLVGRAGTKRAVSYKRRPEHKKRAVSYKRLPEHKAQPSSGLGGRRQGRREGRAHVLWEAGRGGSGRLSQKR